MSFHFAPRVPGESIKASLVRHEHYLAHVLGLRPGMVVADLGCGNGGPLWERLVFLQGASLPAFARMTGYPKVTESWSL